MKIHEQAWSIELRAYLIDSINTAVQSITNLYGGKTAIFIEHNEPDVIYVYRTNRYMINNGNYYTAGEKILYAKIYISQYNKKPTNPKLRQLQNVGLINEIITGYHAKLAKELIAIKANTKL